ncbi:MAG: hypothetical protein EA401_09045 [Planctomycetota bacterium]|nr:MAG: hypothetical protein EA401_09045 [Planctomycetota bacterium]
MSGRTVARQWEVPTISTMKLYLTTAILAAATLFSSGCVRDQDDRTVLHRETEIAELEAKIGALETALAREQARVVEVPEPTGPSLDDELDGTGATTSTRGREVVITVGNEILFRSGSADLTANAKRSLARIVEVINRRYPGKEIRVDGHTDNEPIRRTRDLWSDNWQLSGARSLAVLRELISAGISEDRIFFAGFGEFSPVADNATRANRQKNRRVDIVVIDGNP